MSRELSRIEFEGYNQVPGTSERTGAMSVEAYPGLTLSAGDLGVLAVRMVKADGKERRVERLYPWTRVKFCDFADAPAAPSVKK